MEIYIKYIYLIIRKQTSDGIDLCWARRKKSKYVDHNQTESLVIVVTHTLKLGELCSHLNGTHETSTSRKLPKQLGSLEHGCR